MPFTPFHIGLPVLTLGLFYWFSSDASYWKANWSIPFGMIVGSIIPDIQGFAAIFLGWDVPLHGFSHTLVGGVIYSFIIALISSILIYKLKIEFFEYKGFGTFKSLFLFTLCGILFFHIFPDVFVYPDIKIFWPFSSFNIGRLENYDIVANILSGAFFLGIAIFILKFVLTNINDTTQIA